LAEARESGGTTGGARYRIGYYRAPQVKDILHELGGEHVMGEFVVTIFP